MRGPDEVAGGAAVAETTAALATWTDGHRAPTGDVEIVGQGRYVLRELIGFGGFGQVYRALDRLSNETVAVKLVPALSPRELHRSRRELAALRWLRLPGVVRLRDDGIEGATRFLVMDLVDGRPFGSGAPPPGGWLPVALELLEVLARVHLAGVVHLDLKPGNVLVTAEGRVVVLDFGIARGRAVPPQPTGRIEGSPGYMAPEQARGASSDARTDLYAVGRLLSPLLVSLPADAAPVVHALCADAPAGRPASALDAYERLAGRRPFPRALDRADPWTREALLAWFGGPDRLAHTAEDAVAILWAQTGGAPGPVRELVRSWLAEGRVSWSGDRLLVDRLGVERLRGGLDPDWSQHDPARVVREATAKARRQRRGGRLDAAAALLDAVAPVLDELPERVRSRLAAELRAERTLAALSMERPDAAELALYTLDRAPPDDDVAGLTALVHLARSVLRGDTAAATAQAAEVPPLPHPELEVWRQGYRVQAARLVGPEAERALLDTLAAWAGDDRLRRAKWTSWRANHDYRLGRFVEAAAAHEQAVAGKSGVDRLSSAVNAASAWLEALELDQAERWARRAARQARRLRHPTFEAVSTWLVRTAAYRRGRPRPPDPSLVAAARAVKPYLGALFATTDAATWFRRGRLDACAAQARQAAPWFAQAGLAHGALLLEALAAWCDRDAPALTLLAEQAQGCSVPDIELQVLAFARWAHADPPVAWLDRSRAAAEARPAAQHGVRLDVLSVAEALAPRAVQP